MTAIPKPKRSTTKATKAKCVALSAKITTHSGQCCTCTNTKKTAGIIYSSHIVSRGHERTVARLDNQVPQCPECATYFTDNPKEWHLFVDEKFHGRRLMLEAVARSQPGVGMDWEEIYRGLVDEAKIKGIM